MSNWAHFKFGDRFIELIVLCCNDSFKQGHIVFTGFVQFVTQFHQCFQIIDGITEFKLTKISIWSEGINERADLITEILLFTENGQILNASFELLLHDGGGSLREDLHFLDNFHINFKGSCPLQRVTGSVVISLLNLQLAYLIQCFGCCLLWCVELYCLLIWQDGFIVVVWLGVSQALEQVSLWIVVVLVYQKFQVLQSLTYLVVLDISDCSFEQSFEIHFLL